MVICNLALLAGPSTNNSRRPRRRMNVIFTCGRCCFYKYLRPSSFRRAECCDCSEVLLAALRTRSTIRDGKKWSFCLRSCNFFLSIPIEGKAQRQLNLAFPVVGSTTTSLTFLVKNHLLCVLLEALALDGVDFYMLDSLMAYNCCSELTSLQAPPRRRYEESFTESIVLEDQA